MGKLSKWGIGPTPIDIRVYTHLVRQAEEKEKKSRPDHILMEKEMEASPEYIKIKRKEWKKKQARKHKIWMAINSLSRMQKQCLVFFTDMGWPEKKIAYALKISQPTVSKHIEEARKNLQRKLSKLIPKTRRI